MLAKECRTILNRAVYVPAPDELPQTMPQFVYAQPRYPTEPYSNATGFYVYPPQGPVVYTSTPTAPQPSYTNVNV
jgi:hypothetical protein